MTHVFVDMNTKKVERVDAFTAMLSKLITVICIFSVVCETSYNFVLLIFRESMFIINRSLILSSSVFTLLCICAVSLKPIKFRKLEKVLLSAYGMLLNKH